MLYSPSLPPSLFSLASSPCSHSIPLPTEAESAALALQLSPRRSRSLLGLDRSHCSGAALAEPLSKAWPLQVPSWHRSPTHWGHCTAPKFPNAQTRGCWCYPIVHGPTCLSIPSAHNDTVVAPLGDTSQSQLLVSAGGGTVSSVPLKPLRFMHALKCFAKSTPPRWG